MILCDPAPSNDPTSNEWGAPYATITIVMAARTRVNSAAKIEGNEVIKKTLKLTGV